MTEEQKRARLRTLMDATVRNEPNWHYAAVRPLSYPTLEQAEHESVRSDCSYGVKTLAHLAGIPDPTGATPGYGNSTSIYLHLPHIPLSKVKVGDVVVFGVEGSQHAAMVFTVGKRTPATVKVWSHGQERGPIIVSLAAEIAAHPGAPVTYCRILAPTPPAARGPHWFQNALELPPMWAWISWKDHGAPKRWRPTNVPRVVPPTWWARYRRHVGAADRA